MAETELCVRCGLADDHPKEHVGQPDGSILSFHHDCSDTVISKIIVDHAQGKQGEDLRAHLVEHGDEILDQYLAVMAAAEATNG